MTRLGELVTVNPRPSLPKEPRSAIGLADIDPVSASATPRVFQSADEAPGHHRLALPGDVIFAQISPSMENGKVALVPETETGGVLVSSELMVLRPKSGVEKELVWAFLRRQALRDALREYMVGTVRPRLAREILEAVEVPEVMPRRWATAVEALEHLDRAVLLRRRLFDEMRHLVGVAFARATAAEERLPLASVTEITPGNSEGAEEEEGTVPLLGGADLRDGSIEVSVPSFAPDDARRLRPLDLGDVLIARIGPDLGKAAVYEDEPQEASFGGGLARIRGGHFLGDLVWGWLQTAEASQYLGASATGAGIPTLTLGALAELPIPALRGRWVELSLFAKAVRMALRAANRQLGLLERLTQAHLARVFAGPVSVPEASLESAPTEAVPPALREIFGHASSAQRQVWLKAARMQGPFRVADLVDSELDRATLQHTLAVLEQLGVLICERDGVIASWRLPHAEEDLVG